VIAATALVAACGGGSGSTGITNSTGALLRVTITGDGGAASSTEAAAALAAGSAALETRSLSVNAGFSGNAHDLQVFEGASYVAHLRDCDGGADTDCVLEAATAGTAFGAPTPLSVGGVPVCLLVDYVSDLSGTFDLQTGALSEEAEVAIRVHLGDDIARPCSACVPVDRDPELGEAGVCAGGPDEGHPCTVEALADPSLLDFRGTSLACRPSGEPIGRFATRASATTGDFVLATSAASPNCRALGWRDRKCLCDVCDDPEATPCRSNDDCPSNAGAPGVCGATSRGAATRQNVCDDQVCTPTGAETGICAGGPAESHCAVQTFRSCSSDADCPTAGDVCGTPSPRSCFPDRIALTGEADLLEQGVAHPTLVGGFCAGTFGSPAVDLAGGFPGPISYVWPARIEIEQ
jgi:hypothetical protein